MERRRSSRAIREAEQQSKNSDMKLDSSDLTETAFKNLTCFYFQGIKLASAYIMNEVMFAAGCLHLQSGESFLEKYASMRRFPSQAASRIKQQFRKRLAELQVPKDKKTRAVMVAKELDLIVHLNWYRKMWHICRNDKGSPSSKCRARFRCAHAVSTLLDTAHWFYAAVVARCDGYDSLRRMRDYVKLWKESYETREPEIKLCRLRKLKESSVPPRSTADNDRDEGVKDSMPANPRSVIKKVDAKTDKVTGDDISAPRRTVSPKAPRKEHTIKSRNHATHAFVRSRKGDTGKREAKSAVAVNRTSARIRAANDRRDAVLKNAEKRKQARKQWASLPARCHEPAPGFSTLVATTHRDPSDRSNTIPLLLPTNFKNSKWLKERYDAFQLLDMELPKDIKDVKESESIRLLHILQPAYNKTDARYHQGVFYNGSKLASDGCHMIDCRVSGSVNIAVQLPDGASTTIQASSVSDQTNFLSCCHNLARSMNNSKAVPYIRKERGDLGGMWACGQKKYKNESYVHGQYVVEELDAFVNEARLYIEQHCPRLFAELCEHSKDFRADKQFESDGMFGVCVFISTGYTNSLHADFDDSSESCAIWTCQGQDPEYWFFVFPDLSVVRPDGTRSKGVAFHLFDGAVIIWDGRLLRHCTAADADYSGKLFGTALVGC
jgi:hypothetical protein